MSTTISEDCGVSVEAAADYAGFWLRAVAFLIDYVALLIPSSAIFFGFLFFISLSIERESLGSALLLLLGWAVFDVLARCFYFVLLEASPLQATIGKKAIGLRVCDMQGHRITLGRSLGRNLAKCLSILSVGIGFVMCGFTDKKQALHDMIASCLVVRRP
jgi:uncharacterized RDD family membrane protein YckC